MLTLKGQFFPLLKRNRGKFTLKTAGSSCTACVCVCMRKSEQKTKSKFFVARSSSAKPEKVPPIQQLSKGI